MVVKSFDKAIRLRVVGCGVMESSAAIAVQSCEVNWGPLSDDMSLRMPKRVIQ